MPPIEVEATSLRALSSQFLPGPELRGARTENNRARVPHPVGAAGDDLGARAQLLRRGAKLAGAHVDRALERRGGALERPRRAREIAQRDRGLARPRRRAGGALFRAVRGLLSWVG